MACTPWGDSFAVRTTRTPSVLPFKIGKELGGTLRSDSDAAIYGVDPSRLGLRMRDRWTFINQVWVDNKGENNKIVDLLDRIDRVGALRVQLGPSTSTRLVYKASGRPTAAVVTDPKPLIENSLWWIDCRTRAEADYIAAIMNSDPLWNAVEPLMPKGQYGPRHVHRHPWRLAIPDYDGKQSLHRELAEAGGEAASSAGMRLAELQAEREAKGKALSQVTAKNGLREWLETAPLGRRIDVLVRELLAGGR